MFTPLPHLPPPQLQLGEGLFLADADIPALMACGDFARFLADPAAFCGHVLGTAAEGCEFRCVPRVLHTGQRSLRTPTRADLQPVAWEVTLTGLLTAVTPENIAVLLCAPLPGDVRQAAIAPGDGHAAPDNLCWVGATSAGLMLIELHAPLSTGGLQFRSGQDAGRTPFAFTARQRFPGEQPPCHVYFLKEGEC